MEKPWEDTVKTIREPDGWYVKVPWQPDLMGPWETKWEALRYSYLVFNVE